MLALCEALGQALGIFLEETAPAPPPCRQGGRWRVLTALCAWTHGALSQTLKKKAGFVLTFSSFLTQRSISEGCYTCPFLKMFFRITSTEEE